MTAPDIEQEKGTLLVNDSTIKTSIPNTQNTTIITGTGNQPVKANLFIGGLRKKHSMALSNTDSAPLEEIIDKQEDEEEQNSSQRERNLTVAPGTVKNSLPIQSLMAA